MNASSIAASILIITCLTLLFLTLYCKDRRSSTLDALQAALDLNDKIASEHKAAVEYSESIKRLSRLDKQDIERLELECIRLKKEISTLNAKLLKEQQTVRHWEANFTRAIERETARSVALTSALQTGERQVSGRS